MIHQVPMSRASRVKSNVNEDLYKACETSWHIVFAFVSMCSMCFHGTKYPQVKLHGQGCTGYLRSLRYDTV